MRQTGFGHKLSQWRAEHPRFQSHIDQTCLRCRGDLSSPHMKYCAPCKVAIAVAERNRLKPRRRRIAVTHIAGYVPPSGSIAWSLLGTVVSPR